MSFPHIDVICERCGYEQGTHILYGHKVYLVDGEEVPLSCDLGWCNSCQALTPVECFDDAEEVQNEINKINGVIQERASEYNDYIHKIRFRWLPIHRRYIKNYKGLIGRFSSERQGLELRLALIKKRQGDESCLYCGSRDITVPINQFKPDHGRVANSIPHSVATTCDYTFG